MKSLLEYIRVRETEASRTNPGLGHQTAPLYNTENRGEGIEGLSDAIDRMFVFPQTHMLNYNP